MDTGPVLLICCRAMLEIALVPFYTSLVWQDRGSGPRPPAREADVKPPSHRDGDLLHKLFPQDHRIYNYYMIVYFVGVQHIVYGCYERDTDKKMEDKMCEHIESKDAEDVACTMIHCDSLV